ncbi:MAG: hypothetical protein HC859_00715 [Bacteroidia bacterium]|nr:hypothetical protein [Bacteroidia bacterium]
MFNIGVNWAPSKITIREASIHFLGVLKALSEIDQLFSTPVFSKDNQKDVSFLIRETSDDEAVSLISSTILNFSKYDIRKYEKEQNPTVEYSRDFGFSFVLSYKENDQELSFVPRIGSAEACGMNVLSCRGIDMTFSWSYNLLRALVLGSNAIRGVVGIRDLPFQKACKNVAAPLGWITYFSNDFKPEVPNDLEGIEYEYTDKGKYLILTREDFTTDKETYEAHKEKLFSLMEEIKQRVPEYSK